MSVYVCRRSGQEILALQYKRLALNDAEQCLSMPHTHTEYFTSGREHVLVLFAEYTQIVWLAPYTSMSQACLERAEDKYYTFYYT